MLRQEPRRKTFLTYAWWWSWWITRISADLPCAGSVQNACTVQTKYKFFVNNNFGTNGSELIQDFGSPVLSICLLMQVANLLAFLGRRHVAGRINNNYEAAAPLVNCGGRLRSACVYSSRSCLIFGDWVAAKSQWFALRFFCRFCKTKSPKDELL